MRILTSEGDRLLEIDPRVDKATSTCDPCITIANVQIEGPKTEIQLSKDPETAGLLIEVGLPELTSLKILIEKEDVKKLKALMNKEAIAFMVKAFM